MSKSQREGFTGQGRPFWEGGIHARSGGWKETSHGKIIGKGDPGEWNSMCKHLELRPNLGSLLGWKEKRVCGKDSTKAPLVKSLDCLWRWWVSIEGFQQGKWHHLISILEKTIYRTDSQGVISSSSLKWVRFNCTVDESSTSLFLFFCGNGTSGKLSFLSNKAEGRMLDSRQEGITIYRAHKHTSHTRPHVTWPYLPPHPPGLLLSKTKVFGDQLPEDLCTYFLPALLRMLFSVSSWPDAYFSSMSQVKDPKLREAFPKFPDY